MLRQHSESPGTEMTRRLVTERGVTIVLWSARSATCPLSGTAVSVPWIHEAFASIQGHRRKQAAPRAPSKHSGVTHPCSPISCLPGKLRSSSTPPKSAREVKASSAQVFGFGDMGLISTTTTINTNHMHSYRESGMTITNVRHILHDNHYTYTSHSFYSDEDTQNTRKHHTGAISGRKEYRLQGREYWGPPGSLPPDRHVQHGIFTIA